METNNKINGLFTFKTFRKSYKLYNLSPLRHLKAYEGRSKFEAWLSSDSFCNVKCCGPYPWTLNSACRLLAYFTRYSVLKIVGGAVWLILTAIRIFRHWRTFSRSRYTIEWPLYTTGNTLCGTWYLPHSLVHDKGTVPIIIAGCIAHAQNGRIFTSDLKSDVTIVFLGPDFL